MILYSISYLVFFFYTIIHQLPGRPESVGNFGHKIKNSTRDDVQLGVTQSGYSPVSPARRIKRHPHIPRRTDGTFLEFRLGLWRYHLNLTRIDPVVSRTTFCVRLRIESDCVSLIRRAASGSQISDGRYPVEEKNSCLINYTDRPITTTLLSKSNAEIDWKTI